MTKEVLISISGLQATAEDSSDQVEVILPGEYYYRNNKHYLLFEEVLEGTREVTRSTIKLSDRCMELTRKGPVSTHMIFEKDHHNQTYYNTPFGSILMGIETKKIRLEESESAIEAEVLYSLDMNYEKVSDSTIHMLIRPKNDGNLRLVN